MRYLQKKIEVSTKEGIKEAYMVPTITNHDNLKQITKDLLNFSYSSDDDEVPAPPAP
jgi:hypothetical protein